MSGISTDQKPVLVSQTMSTKNAKIDPIGNDGSAYQVEELKEEHADSRDFVHSNFSHTWKDGVGFGP